MAQHTLDLPVVTIPETGTKHVLLTDKELKVEKDTADGNVKDLERRLEAVRDRLSRVDSEEGEEELSSARDEELALMRQVEVARKIQDRLMVAISNRETILPSAEIVSVQVRVPTYDELTKAESLYRSLENDRFVTDRGKVIQHLMRTCAPDVSGMHPAIGKHVERWLMRAVWPEDELLPFWYIALNRS